MKKEYFNIPNLMGYFRILLIPVFLVLYFRADTRQDYMIALFVLVVSYLTDFFDGKIARKFHMVTDWGKALDPVADKLTQGALAVALTFRYPLMVWFCALFLCKEIYMMVMGLYLIRKEKSVNGAQRYGKICTAVIDVGIFILLLFPGLSALAANILLIIMTAVMCAALYRYILFHRAILKGQSVKKTRKYKSIIVLLFLLVYIIFGGALPYLKQPELSREYEETFKTEDFYAKDVSCDVVMVIEDNGEALAERIRMIEHAENRIILSTFDFRTDTSGKQMLAALREAALRGVQVQILMDGFNSWLRMEGNPYFYSLASEENVEIKIYNRANPLIPWKGMSRMHDKYLVVDNSGYILGGRNTFDYFLGNQEGYKNYDRDVLVYNTGGSSSVYQIQDYFAAIWDMDCCKLWHSTGRDAWIPSVRKAGQELQQIYVCMQKKHADWFESVDYTERAGTVNKITLLSNPTGLYAKEPELFYALKKLMAEADEEVLIHTPYIMCNDMMYQSFREICSGEASVFLMTNSAVNNGNPFGAVDYVIHKEEILRTGLQVLEYEGGVSYHGKSIVIDDDIAIIGSFNMDMKSVYQDTELMLVINSRDVAAQLKENLLEYQKYAKPAVLDDGEMGDLFSKEVSLMKRIQRWVIKVLDPWLRFLL